MSDVPLIINEQRVYLRFEYGDMKKLERDTGSILNLFKPENIGFSSAVMFLKHGARDESGNHCFTPDAVGEMAAVAMVQQFVKQFEQPQQAFAIFYYTIQEALYNGGWFNRPSGEPSKNP